MNKLIITFGLAGFILATSVLFARADETVSGTSNVVSAGMIKKDILNSREIARFRATSHFFNG